MKKRRNDHQQYNDQEERQDRIELTDGIIEETLPGTLFLVGFKSGHKVICTLSGKLRLNRIRLLLGDHVTVEVSPYDLSKGRVVWRG